MNDIGDLQAAIKDAQINGKPKEITANRGRLIRKLREEISKAKSSSSPEEAKELAKMEELLGTTIDEHKNQINGRYKTEFVNQAGSIKSVITALPKGVGLAIEKIKTCISSLKDAKTNKEKLFGVIDTLKAVGMLAATPFVFTGKFIVKHWYLVVLFIAYVIDLPGYLIRKTGENFIHGGNLLEDIKETLQNEEELKEIGENAKERLHHIPENLKKDYEGAKRVFLFLKENFRTIYKLLHREDATPEQKDLFKRIQELTSEKDPIDLTDPETIKESWNLFEKIRELVPELEQGPVPSLSPAR